MFNQNQDYASTQLVGSFSVEKDRDFRDGISNLLESFANNYRIDPVDGIMSILKNETLNEAYKGQLLDDVLNENYGDPYMDLLPSKVEQLYENTRTELLEGYMGQMNPIVGLSLPILKKNFLSCQAKDIVMTEVPDKPYIRMQYERDFLKDKEGNRYYIPEIFYNNEHIAVSEKGRGKAVTDKWFGGTGTEVEEDTLNIIKRKNITTKPMDEEEAILQMELLNHDFFVFKNIDEECVSVIYKRKDNDYGIINVK